MISLSLIVLMGMLGLVVDVGYAHFVKMRCLTAAQSAAIAGAMAAKSLTMTCGTGSTQVPCQAATACPATLATPTTNPVTAACLFAQQNGFTNGGKISVKVAANLSNAVASPVPGISPTYWLQVTVTQQLPQTFSAALGKTLATVAAESTSGYFQAGGGGGCIYTLNTSGSDITNSGNVSITSGCGIYDDSNSSAAILFSGSPTITTTNGATTNVVGGYLKSGSPVISPAPILGAPFQPDPFLGILGAPSGVFSVTPPATGSCQSSVVLSGSGNYTINPGTYCSAITMSGSVNLTMNPGNYVLQGGITMSGSTSISGTGVLLYVPSGGITMSGTGGITLSGPTSGAYQGIVLWQPYSNSSGDTLSGGSTQQINGVVYLPASTLTFSGGSGIGTNTTLVVGAMVMSGNTFINNPAPNAYVGGASAISIIE
jgi:hypothetical protein